MNSPVQAHEPDELLTIQEAGAWASGHLGKQVTASNISYLVQYGKIERRGGLVSRSELATYYAEFYGRREQDWKAKLGADVNWRLSFEELKETDTTKHVHRLHPYKGKFIPQLVEYFLDSHTDEFKQEAFFRPGDVVLDPFSGSGTTVAQANELGLQRRDADEIGPLFSGQGKAAQESYVAGIAAVLRNCRRFLAADFDIFLVANDKYDLYPAIAEKSGLAIVNRYKRPVLNRTERSKTAYAEVIFHLR